MNNFVAKHAKRYNVSSVFKDRKREAKRGYTKHKNKWKSYPKDSG